jgi:hypothetical protein
VLTHAGFFATKVIDGNTDQELEDAAAAGFVTSTNELTLDGEALPLQAIDTGAYDIISEPGGFYDTIGVGTGTIRQPDLPASAHARRSRDRGCGELRGRRAVQRDVPRTRG